MNLSHKLCFIKDIAFVHFFLDFNIARAPSIERYQQSDLKHNTLLLFAPAQWLCTVTIRQILEFPNLRFILFTSLFIISVFLVCLYLTVDFSF